MHAVAELVRQRHHVARLALVVEQHIRMRRRHGRMRESARLLARAHRRVDPVLLEEAVGDFRHLGRERAISGEHGRARVGPGNRALRHLRQRRVAIPIGQPLLAEPFRLQAHNSGATASDRRRARRRPAPPPLRARPGWHRWRASATSLKPRQRSEISLSLASVLVISVNGRKFALKVLASACAAALRFLPSASCSMLSAGSIGERLAADLEAQARDGLVVIAVPGRIAGDRLLVEQLLDPVLELIGLFLAHVLDPGPVMAERGIGHGGLERGVVDAVELEREEQEMQRGGGDALLHVAVELGAHRIGGVAGIEQRGIGDRAGRACRRSPRSA